MCMHTKRENTFSAVVPAYYIEGLAKDPSNSVANALQLLQSCPKPLVYQLKIKEYHGSSLQTDV